MFDPFTLRDTVRRFEGPGGWFYVPLDADESAKLRPLVSQAWPALIKVHARVGAVSWTATVMPIKDGPLFVALPAPIRRRLGTTEGDPIALDISPA